ncbi:MAG: phosphatase PAP2 family protein [Candidatus Symbiothrix sp.]|jgi:membrane-associated phospholipid phosphatase|nr:phosphatase PAP2 family protein [Candidatus Symbiothrix sp.]
MRHLTIVILIFCFTVRPALAQQDTTHLKSAEYSPSVWAWIVPSALVSYGILTRLTPALQDVDKQIDRPFAKHFHRQYAFDDYILYTPILGVYGLDLCGVKAKHNFLDRTLVIGSASVMCAGVSFCGKEWIDVRRPDGSEQSFPSRHTAFAFMLSHILFREYQDVSPWIGIAGYGIGATTGVMRMVNRRHWFSDVITGAGVGILSTELSYLLLPVWHKLLKIEPQTAGISLLPMVGSDQIGLGGVIRF